MKSEIEAKMNLMIQVFLKDIYAFLENIEEIALEREKLKDLDRTKQENKSLKNQLQEKSKNECRLKSEIDALNKKLNVLKAKLNEMGFSEKVSENTVTIPTGQGYNLTVDSNWFDRFCNFISSIFGG